MDLVLLSIVAILGAGVFAQWIAWRAGIPSILLLLLLGLAAGPGLGWLDPDALFGELLLPLVSLSVAVILYEGGLSLRLRELRQVGSVVRNLCTIGALVTWTGGTLAARICFDVPWSIALLLGAIFIVTGPTVVGPLLRQIRPRRSVATALTWEGIVTDPLGVMAAVLVFEAILHGPANADPAMDVIRTLGMGSLYGAGAGVLMAFLLRRHLVPDHLQNPVSLVLVFVVYAASDAAQPEAGLLGVTVMGIVLANQRGADVRHIVEFKASLQLLLLAVLFVLLAARIDREVLLGIGWRHFAFLGALLFVVRPATVLVSAAGSGMPWRERAFLALCAPRGIVAAAMSSVLALQLKAAGVEHADLVVPVTFLVIVGSVIFYGLGAPVFARLLGVASSSSRGLLVLGAHDWARELALVLQRLGADVLLVDSNRANVAQARFRGLPVVWENILTETAFDDLDLSDRGTFLAMTPNDEVNALACLRMREVFGRAHVYQLVSVEESERKVELELGGRDLFGEAVTFEVLQTRFAAGWRFAVVDAAGTGTLEDLHEEHGEDVLALFDVFSGGRLVPLDPAIPLLPRESRRFVVMLPAAAPLAR
jgi:NhaP-type Na+/H+ or K+/H+ antiporter